MAHGELKFGLDDATASRLDDLTMQLRSIATSLAPDVRVNTVNAQPGVYPTAPDIPKRIRVTPGSMMGWNTNPPDGLRQALGEAIGRASVCWDEVPHGVFRSEDAQSIVDELVLWIYQAFVPTVQNIEAAGKSEADSGNFTNTVGIGDASKRGWVAVAKPTRCLVSVGDRQVGTFDISARTGLVTVVASTSLSRLTVRGQSWPNLETAVKAVMDAGSWDDLSNDEVFITWECRVQSSVDSDDEIEDDDEV